MAYLIDPTPIILFPIAGCDPAGSLTREQVEAKLAILRGTIRRDWDTDGIKAVVSFLEISTARLTKEGIDPQSGPHQQGQAHGANYLLSALVHVANSAEHVPEQPQQP